jgi:response regulator of citrate/malate metabolism
LKNKPKILLIESDYNIGKLICSHLEKVGFEITETVPFFFNAIESIEHHKPDLVILDSNISEPIAYFISNNIKFPLMIISDQNEKEILKYSEKITIISVISNPYKYDSMTVHLLSYFGNFLFASEK